MTTLGLFARHPVPGRCKTRLAAALGPEIAARLAAAFLHDTLHRVEGMAARRIIAYTPDTPESRSYFAGLAARDDELWPQPEGSLGTRLEQFFERAFASGAAAAVVIGTDSPTLPRAYVAQAFEALQQHDCVLGPADDGGYYLLGLRRHCASLFSGIDWGTSAVFEQTLRAAQRTGLTVSVGPNWYDVDTLDDLRRLHNELAAATAAEGHRCSRTAAVLNAIFTAPSETPRP